MVSLWEINQREKCDAGALAMNYICDTGDEKLDAMLRVMLEHLRGTSAEDCRSGKCF